MEVYEALEKFIDTTVKIDVCQKTMAHIVWGGQYKIAIMITGSKAESTKNYTEREDGVISFGNTDNGDTVSSGEIYVEFDDVEIFTSSNPVIINKIANQIKDRYDVIKEQKTLKFIDLVNDIPSVDINLHNDQLSRL